MRNPNPPLPSDEPPPIACITCVGLKVAQATAWRFKDLAGTQQAIEQLEQHQREVHEGHAP